MEKLDAILNSEEAILPSSGFAAAVMQRVREEAAAPPPIPFPWKRAIPGFILTAIVSSFVTVKFVHAFRATGFSLPFSPIRLGVHMPLDASQAGWLLIAVALAAGAWLLTRHLASSSSGLL